MRAAGRGVEFPWPHHQPIHNLRTLRPLLWHPCLRYPSQAVTPSSPPAFCPLPGNSAASVSRLAASQRCPETASSRQPPPRAPAPTPPRRRDPGLGTMCSVRKEGGLATLGGLRGPGKGPGAGERGRRGGRSPAAPPPARGDRCGGSPVIGREEARDTHYKYGHS